MKELDKQLKEAKEFLEKFTTTDGLTIDIVLMLIRTAYLQGRIDVLESKYAQNNKK